MSISNRRSYLCRQRRGAGQERVRSRTALGQAGIALGAVNRRLVAEAPKPVYAVLGAADLVAASVTKRAEELPTDAAQGVNKAQQTGQALIIRAQTEAACRLGELRGRIASGRQVVTTLPGAAGPPVRAT